MNKNTLLRRLAESHFFCKKELTVEEVALLKNSQFSNVLNNKSSSEFLKLVEKEVEKIEANKLSKSDTVAEEPTSTTPFSKHKRFHHVNANEVEIMLDELAEHFKLGVPADYSKIELNQLKDFIRDYIQHSIFSQDTKHEIEKALAFDSSEQIVGTLYTHMCM